MTLGSIYLKDENIQKALENFNKFREASSKADKKAMAMADEAIQTCHNAIALMSVPRNFKVITSIRSSIQSIPNITLWCLRTKALWPSRP